MDLLAGLNPEQKIAVNHNEGPLLILAGAGSGKTKVLTHRIARLISEGLAKPWEIMAITFTNKAAKEMRDRIDLLMGDEASQIWVSTFHAICVRILRRDIEKLGYTGNFVIYDTQDKQMLLRDCVKDLNLSEKSFPPRMLGDMIGKAKDKLLSPDDYEREFKHDFQKVKVCSVYRLYQQRLKDNNALDFDDLIFYTIKLFKDAPAVLEYYQNKFKYMLVDEYQDTNMAQYLLINMLAKKHCNLCVVGDDDQSIYAWRGADIRNILEFEKDYDRCKVIKLEQNYRSTPEILQAANVVISKNAGRKDKKLWTANGEGQKPAVFNAENQFEEARFVATEIRRYASKRASESGKEINYSDFAVLYRTNAQSRVFEEQFMKDGLPYRIFGGMKFYDRKEIKDIIAYLRVIMNAADSVSLKRIINVPKRGLGVATVEKAERQAETEGCTLFDVIMAVEKYPEMRRSMISLKHFGEMIKGFMSLAETLSVSGLVEHVIEQCGLVEELKEENTIEARARIENIEEFVSVATQFEQENEDTSLEAFLAQVSLVNDIDDLSDDNGEVVMMTLHSAKGLEFPVVFMVGMEDGLFPGYNSIAEGEEKIEEERRLCYVGMTRAEQKLFMTYANTRTIFGKTERYIPSRFLNEIPDEYLSGVSGRSVSMMNRQREKEMVEAKIQRKIATNNAKYKIDNSDSVFGINHVSRGFGAGVSESIKRNAPSGSRSGTSGAGTVGSAGFADVASGVNISTGKNLKFNVGDKVTHKKFGNGVVGKIDGTGEAQKIEIDFESCGMKRLMTAYANLNKVD